MARIKRSGSPFNAVKQSSKDGSFWMASDLRPLLGQLEWYEFRAAIDQARSRYAIGGRDAKDHWIVTAGPDALDHDDVRMTHEGCCMLVSVLREKLGPRLDYENYFADKNSQNHQIVRRFACDRLRYAEGAAVLTADVFSEFHQWAAETYTRGKVFLMSDTAIGIELKRIFPLLYKSRLRIKGIRAVHYLDLELQSANNQSGDEDA